MFWVFWLPPTLKNMQVGVIGHSNLDCRCECEREHCSSLYVSPVMHLILRIQRRGEKEAREPDSFLRAEFMKCLN